MLRIPRRCHLSRVLAAAHSSSAMLDNTDLGAIAVAIPVDVLAAFL